MTSILAFGAPGPGTLIVILIIAVLLFGKRCRKSAGPSARAWWSSRRG